MKRIAVECAVFAFLLFVIPLFAMFGTPAAAREEEPPASSPLDTQESEEDGFSILDTSTGEVVQVSRLEFLRGGTAAEVPPTYEPEALKAQAIAAYTYYARLRDQQRASPDPSLKGADFSADLSIGEKYVTPALMESRYEERAAEYTARLDEAARAVDGLALTYNGELIEAVFFAISSGATESSADMWGGERPYLVAVASPGDSYASGFQTQADFSAEEVREALLSLDSSLSLGEDPAAWLGGSTRTPSGSVLSLTAGGKELSGADVRSALGLRSQNFTAACSGDAFTFTVRGYGHGVGMSQVGAQAMAQQGAAWQEIVSWYYPGVSITPMG